MPDGFDEAWDRLISAMNKVAGCALLSFRSNPDLQRIIEEMRDAEFALQAVIDGDAA